jgi:hypothetical protein
MMEPQSVDSVRKPVDIVGASREMVSRPRMRHPAAVLSGRVRSILGATLVVTVLLCPSMEARADGSKPDFEGAFRVGVAGAPTGATLGGRFGVQYLHVYVGLPFDYDFGERSVTSFAFGVELGYGFVFGPNTLTLRPTMGVGNLTTYSPAAGVGNVVDLQTIYFEPGVTLLVDVAAGLFVGADVGEMLWPSNSSCPPSTGVLGGPCGTSFVAHLQAGMRF